MNSSNSRKPEIPFQDLRKTNGPLMDRLAEAAVRVLRSGRYINGPEVKAFEEELARESGTKYCVAVSTGLDALRLILRGYISMGRLKEGDEVIIPANTFIATFLAASDCGLKIVAAEADERTYCLDYSKLLLSPKTKALITVHLFGRPCWDERATAELKSKGLIIIEDNAQALGASFMGRKTGSLGDAAAISFYPAKNIGACGDAGAVVTDDHELAVIIRKLANYGAEKKYVHETRGYNCRMDELQAALLRVKLPTLAEVTRRRSENASHYDRYITNPEVKKPERESGSVTATWHQYVVRHPRRDALRKYLEENGVGTEIHYPVACHRQPCYDMDVSLPVAERLAGEILSLPIADIGEEEIKHISTLINQFRG